MAVTPEHLPPVTGTGPYLGLDFFTEAEAGVFFGRNGDRRMIVANLRAARLTVLYAASGVGKSSLLRAGVAARLRELAARSFAERGSARHIPVVFASWRDEPIDGSSRRWNGRSARSRRSEPERRWRVRTSPTHSQRLLT